MNSFEILAGATGNSKAVWRLLYTALLFNSSRLSGIILFFLLLFFLNENK